MGKLYLASFGFKVGDNKFEETRLVVSSSKAIEDVTGEACLAWKLESKGTEREMLSCRISETLTMEIGEKGVDRKPPKDLEEALNDLKQVFRTEAAHKFIDDCIKVLGFEAAIVSEEKLNDLPGAFNIGKFPTWAEFIEEEFFNMKLPLGFSEK